MKRKSQLVAMTLFALAFSACSESTNEVNIPAAEQKQVDPSAADVVPQRKAPRVISNEISDSDLGLGDPENTALEANGKSANVLEEAYEVIERYEDESVKRRWFVRLYVTFDRTKPWHQQAPGSWVQHGEFEEFYPDGEQLLMQGNYREGKRDG